jgi:hypothetical protein
MQLDQKERYSKARSLDSSCGGFGIFVGIDPLYTEVVTKIRTVYASQEKKIAKNSRILSN